QRAVAAALKPMREKKRPWLSRVAAIGRKRTITAADAFHFQRSFAMPVFSFTEKEWDRIRPSSVKKTGVTDGIKAVLKGVPKDLKALGDGKDCDKSVALLTELNAAFDKANGMIKPKDDKHDAAKKIKTWKAEVKDGCSMIELHKQ